MKVGIVTFQETNNYGALLQNYALSRAFRKNGAEPKTINYISEYIGKPYRFSHLKNKGLMTYLLGVAGYFIYLPRTIKNNRFRKHIKYTSKVNKTNVKDIVDDFDIFVTGSDQVWNYNLTGGDGYYLLDFVKDKSRCNSYSASLGVKTIDDKYSSEYRELLSDFHYVSVREESAKDALVPVLGKEVDVVADPCVLLSKSEWDKVSNTPREKGYVYVYQLGVSGDAVRLAKKIAKEKGLKVIFTPFPVGGMAVGKFDIFAGAAEVLGYIKNADYVITDSFHGTLLSIIFNKRFFTKASGTHAAVGSRIFDMLNHYGLTDRIISSNTNYKEKIDYERVNALLEDDRKKGMGVIKNILS